LRELGAQLAPSHLAAPAPMPTPVCGVLTGISYVSGLDYYRQINEEVGKLLGKANLMPPNPTMVLSSVDCDLYALLLTTNRTPEVCEHLAAGVARLVAAGCDFLVLASNTAHVSVPTLEERFPSLPILHIADVTATSIRSRGMRRVGLLGTEPTMREEYLKSRLRSHGLEIVVPDSDEDMTRIFQAIMHELGHNIFHDSTRAFFVKMVRKLQVRGCEGVILGCTEIELLELQPHVPDVALFRSAELHIEAASRVCAGLDAVDKYLPADRRASTPPRLPPRLPRLRVEPTPTRLLAAAFLAGCVATLGLAAVLRRPKT